MSSDKTQDKKNFVVILGVIVALCVAAATLGVLVWNASSQTDTVTSEDKKMSSSKKSGTGVETLIIEKSEPKISNNGQMNNFNSSWVHSDDGSIIWRAAGSSSCPPIITEATYDWSENVINLTEANYDGRMCTMDLRPIQQVIRLSEDKEIPKDVTVKISGAVADKGDTDVK